MIYLTGASGEAVRKEQHPQIGLMCQPHNRLYQQIARFPLYAADNACFKQGAHFRLDRYYAWLKQLPRVGCCFATAPDIVADAQATWERSQMVLPVLREMGFPAALVAQDGLQEMEVAWEAFDVLFLGGSTSWKLSSHAARLTAQAKARGKWVHMGRVNSFKRLHYARNIGCDSADGTLIAFAPDKHLPRLVQWLDYLTTHPPLWGIAQENTSTHMEEGYR